MLTVAAGWAILSVVEKPIINTNNNKYILGMYIKF
jgi:hypothetical protein